MSYRIRFTFRDGSSGLLGAEYTTRTEAELEIARRENPNNCMTYTIEEVATPEARIRELEAELAQLRDAYDAARQDRDVAMRNVARLESTLAMVQASWAVTASNLDVARTLAAEAHCKTVASEVRLEAALAIGDAMHRAHPSDEWSAYKESLAASRQGSAKASEAPSPT